MVSDAKRIEWEIRLRDLASDILKRLGTNAKKEADKAEKAFGGFNKILGGSVSSIGKLAAGVGAAAVAFIGLNAVMGKLRQGVDDAVRFSRAMAEVSTISEDVADRLGFVTDQVLDLSTKFGLLETDAATALYQTISAGVTDTSKALDLLDGAVTLSRGGLADLTSTIDLLTNTINAYGLGVEDVEHINNVFFETVRLGKTTITNLADSMGVAMPIAANLGVTVEELSAMLAALTKGGVDTTTAVIYVRQALNSILRPSADAQKLMERLNISFDAGKVKADGFIGILNELKIKLGDNIDEWQKFFPNVRAFIPVLALAGNQFQEFQTILERLTSTSLDDAQPAMRALERVMLSAGDKIQTLSNAMRQGFMEIGLDLITAFTGPIDSVEGLQAGAVALRESIAGLAPVVRAAAGALLLLASMLPKVIQLIVHMGKEMELPGFEKGNAQLDRAVDRMSDVSDMAGEMAMSLMTNGNVSFDVFTDLAERMAANRLQIVQNIAQMEKERDVVLRNADAFQQLKDRMYELGGAARLTVSPFYGATEDFAPEMEAQISNAIARSLKGIDLDDLAIFAGLDDQIVDQLEQVFIDANIKSRNISDVAYRIPEPLMGQLINAIGSAETRIKMEQALSGQMPAMAKAIAAFGEEVGREFTNVQDEIVAAMTPTQFASAVAASLQDAPYVISAIIDDASTGVLAASGKSLEAIYGSMGDGAVSWAKDLYTQLEGEFDTIASQAILGPDALRVLQNNVRKAQNELLKLGGPELRKQLEDDISRTLGMGAVDTAESQAAAERAARIDEANAMIREQGLLLEELKFRSEDSSAAQIAAIKATTEATRQELRLRLESNDQAIKITEQEYERLYAALEEGEKNQVKLVLERAEKEVEAAREASRKEREEFRKRERAWQSFAEKASTIYYTAIEKAATGVTSLFVENLSGVGSNLGAALTDAVGGALGALESFVTVTPAMQLESLVQQVKDAEAQLAGIEAINLASTLVGEDPIFSAEQISSLQEGIDNVKQYELVALKAEVAHEAFLASIGKTPAEFDEMISRLQGFSLEGPSLGFDQAIDSLNNLEAEIELFKIANEQSILSGRGAIISDEALANLEAGVQNMIEFRNMVQQMPEAMQGFYLGAAEIVGEFYRVAEDGKTLLLDHRKIIQDLTVDFVQGFGQALTDTLVAIATGAKKSRDAWRDFARQFVIMIIQMTTQLAVMISLAAILTAIAPGLAQFMFGAERLSAVGLANGGVVKGGLGEMQPFANGGVVLGGLGRALPVKGYATGGPIVDRPHIALIGEGRHNEAVVPLPDGRSIPVEMRGGSDASQQQNINVNISTVDARGIDELLIERSSTLRDIIRQALNEDRIFRNQVASVR